MPERKLIDECVHCGFCLPSCPTYQSWGQEMDSPRGRIVLMKSLAGGAPPSPEVVRHFDRCLGCMTCMTACPSGVNYEALIEDTRAEVERGRRRPAGDRLFRAALFWMFPHPRRLRLAAAAQLVYVKSGLRWLAHALRLVRLLPTRVRALEALMPPVSLGLLTARLPARAPAAGARRARVALLAGCVQRVYFPQVNQATLRVLAAEGCEVVVPRRLGCCGALSLHVGRDDEARRLARAAIAAIERARVDHVVVNAAGCGSAMKHWDRLLDGDAAWRARAAAAAARVVDVSELLVRLGPSAERHPLPVALAYHDACHLQHAQRIRSQPRELLAAIPGVKLTELADSDQCCGSAGVYNLLEPDSAREIGRRKVDAVLAAAPELLVSANPGCTLHIQMLLRERGHAIRTAHVIEVIDASIRGAALPG
ncbi:MAG TPA: heterodisulfide reductase-related iron-sulfur binding cluster [Kofleriaceae bacterium]|nr:heterodisulfide reductase-related iron-sulfur binding cluster [Kofleriaceae bacterium]